MLSLILVVSSAASLAVLQVDAQSRSYRCQSREGRQPNFSDDSCATFLVCSNYSGQLRRCRGGQQYDFSSQSCRADSEVACQQQLRNRPSNPSSTPTSPPSTENRESARSNTLLTLLNALFPQQANNGGIVGLQGNIPPGILPGGLQGNIPPGILPGGLQGNIPPGILPGGLQGIVGAGPFGVQGAAPQNPNQGLFLNFLGNNANAGLGAQAGGIAGLFQNNNLQGGALGNQLDNDLFGGVVDQNVNVVNANGQRTKALNGPAFSPSQKPNFVPTFNQNSPYIPILNQVPQSFLPNTPVAQAFGGNQIPQSQKQYTAEPQIPNPSDTLEQETKPQLTVTFSQLPQPQSPDIYYSQVPQYQPPYTAESFNQIPLSQSSDTPQSQSQYVPVSSNEVPKETTYSNVPQLSGILQ